MKFILRNGDFEETYEVENIELMKEIADATVSYVGDSLKILDASGTGVLCFRPWYGCMDFVNLPTNSIICFGQSGFYGDWIDGLYYGFIA